VRGAGDACAAAFCATSCSSADVMLSTTGEGSQSAACAASLRPAPPPSRPTLQHRRWRSVAFLERTWYLRRGCGCERMNTTHGHNPPNAGF
jgi:hypothetical protein